MYLNWSRIYSIFDNGDLSAIPQDQLVYTNIKSSKLHLIVAIPVFMPYIDAVKWVLNHAKPEERVFNDYIGVIWPLSDLKFFLRVTVLVPRNSY